MNTRHLELADEFCKLVNKSHLLEYLELEEGVTGDEARAEFKKKRKYMQGMQANPKFKTEALFMIKNFHALDQLLHHPSEYLEAVYRQQESAHLPILEMTIRGVLKGGQLTQEQEDYLRRNATDLGLSRATFDETITRLAAQAGISRPGSEITQPDEDEAEPEITDHYGILGVKPDSSREDIYDAYRQRYRKVRTLADRERAEQLYKRLDRAWQVLSDPASRETYDLSVRQTGPPARNRGEEFPWNDEQRTAPTAPPVRSRVMGPGGASPDFDERAASPRQAQAPVSDLLQRPSARLDIVGRPVRQLVLGAQTGTADVIVRNTGDDPMPGRVSTDEPWLIANPTRLDPDRKEQVITVKINPRDLPSRSATGVVTVQTERGDRASIVFEVKRRVARAPLFGAAGVLAALVVLGAVGSAMGWFAPPDRTITISVDPTSEDVLLDGESFGSGPRVEIPDPPAGTRRLTVLQPNFAPYQLELDMAEAAGTTVTVRLVLESDLAFRPDPAMKRRAYSDDQIMRHARERLEAVDACFSAAGIAEGSKQQKVRIHLLPDGHAAGMEYEGGGRDDLELIGCLQRQAAAVSLPPFEDGDYATVGYDY